MDASRRLNLYRELHFGESTQASYYARTDTDGHSYVGVELRRQAAEGPAWVFRGDLDRLEAVIRRGEEIMRDPNGLGAAFSQERIKDYDVKFVAYPNRGMPEKLTLLLERSDEQGRQVFGVTLDRLKAITREGHKVEQELGYDQKRYHTLVYASSLEERGPEMAQATVFKSVASVEEARKLLLGSENLALHPETTRRPFPREETEGAKQTIDVRRDATLEVAKGKTTTVDAQIARNAMENERRSEHFLVARWSYADRPPTPGSRVMWEGNGRAYNGDFEDFKAKPVGARDHGEPKEELYVLIRRDPNDRRFGYGEGTVEAVSPNRREMTAKLAESQMAEYRHRQVTNDGQEQQLGMEARRQEFKHSL